MCPTMLHPKIVPKIHFLRPLTQLKLQVDVTVDAEKQLSYHVRHEGFEMLDGLLSLVLLSLSVDFFGLL